jgi:hypothetical protein
MQRSQENQARIEKMMAVGYISPVGMVSGQSVPGDSSKSSLRDILDVR